MATGLANTPGIPGAGLPTTADHSGERLIQSQLRRAGRYVKWVEAGSQLLTLLIATLIFFLRDLQEYKAGFTIQSLTCRQHEMNNAACLVFIVIFNLEQ